MVHPMACLLREVRRLLPSGMSENLKAKFDWLYGLPFGILIGRRFAQGLCCALDMSNEQGLGFEGILISVSSHSASEMPGFG